MEDTFQEASCDTCWLHRSGVMILWPRNIKPFSLLLLTLLLLLYPPCITSQTDEHRDYPPSMFYQEPATGSPKAIGSLKLLQCYANGDPSPHYSWSKDGEVIPSYTDITDTTLRIDNIQRSDAGIYQCLAFNPHGSLLSTSSYIYVAYMVPFAFTGNQDKVVDQGQARIIDLPNIDSYPPPTITWDVWADGNWERIPAEGQRYHMTIRKQLVVLETRLSSDNNKMFRARALLTQTGEESDSQTFVLKVQNVGSLTNDIPPAIVVPPSHTTAVQGEDAVVLECVANARPLNYLSLKWYRRSSDGERSLIEPDNAKYLLPMYRRRLTILNPITDDSGTYLCEASFSRPGGPDLPTALGQANLTVLVKPSFVTPPPADIIQDVSTTVIIPCVANGLPTPHVTWYRNGVIITEETNNRYLVLSNGNLQISSAESGDSGMFQCFVVNSAGDINRATWVQVRSFPPEITEPPQNQTVIEGDLAAFPCVMSGAPQPTSRWYRVTSTGVEEDLPGESGRILLGEDNKILIPVTVVADTGRYVCNVSNALGFDVAEAYLRVMIRTRITTPPADSEVIKGSAVELNCGVSHDPNVSVHWNWYKDENKIDPSSNPRLQITANGSLVIRQVRNEDIAIYKCEVISTGGNDTADAQLTVIEIPHQPHITSVNLNEENNKAVDVHWGEGFDGGSPITAYIMWYRMVPPGLTLLPDEGWMMVDNNIDAAVRMYTVTSLLPSRTYQFRVAATNAVGTGNPSEASAVVEIPQQPPSGPPQGVVASARSNSSVIVQWEPPKEEDWNGPLLGYMIKFKPSGYPDTTIEYKNITNYLITMDELQGLIVWQEYQIAVAAYNGKGTGIYSEYVMVRTMEGRPTAAPTIIQGLSVNSTSVKLVWKPPDAQFINGINMGYKIHARRLNVPEIEIEKIVLSDLGNMLGNQTGYLLNLRKFTEYRVTVLCFTSQGDGPKSPHIDIQTMQDVPDAVASLIFDNILDTSFRAIWTPPINANGILTGYTLTYQKKNESITKVTKEFDPDTLNYIITGLTATTVYTIEVFAHTEIGPGPPRVADIESGIPPVKPEPPTNLAVTNILATSVLLQFAPGFNGHTSISLWIVEQQTEEEGEWSVVYEKYAPDSTAFTVEDLRPYTRCRLRMISVNIADQSDPSEPTRWFDTLQAPPYDPPNDITMRAINETAIRVGWTPLRSEDWNGEQRAYLISYRSVIAENDTRIVQVTDELANSHVIGHLQEWMEYEVKVAASNAMGTSYYSDGITDRTWEAVPSTGPSNVSASAVDSTTIRVMWDNVTLLDQNGPILGYKVKYVSPEENIEPQLKVVNSSMAREVLLTGLRKFVWYEIQVLAYTRIGDGALSQPKVTIQTHEDVPGSPCCVYFPEVTHSSAKIRWGPPSEPNGIISGYRVGYRLKSNPPDSEIIDDDLEAGSREYFVSGLERDKSYVFSITAKTSSMGWGARNELDVYTIINRPEPSPPTQPQILETQIGDRHVTINWQPNNVNNVYAPIRNFTIQVQRDDESWETVNAVIPHDATSHTVSGLHPHTRYRFRVAANNDIKPSDWSPESRQVLTKQAAPESPPLNLHVIPENRTSVYVTWQIPPRASWNGHLSGYRLDHKRSGEIHWLYKEIYSKDMQYDVVEKLELFNTYEFRIRSFNMYGHSDWSNVAVVYLEIGHPPNHTWNGALDFTEIWYSMIEYDIDGVAALLSSQLDIVPYPYTAANLTSLTMGQVYEIRAASRNLWGSSPLTPPTDIYIGEAVPMAPPQNVSLDMLSSTEMIATWDPPPRDTQNGDIKGYKIYYWESALGSGAGSMQQVGATNTELLLADLGMYTEYSVQILAFNTAGDGPNITEPVTNRTAEGVPGIPGPLGFVVISLTEVNVSWATPSEPNGVIKNYEVSYMEVTPDGESRHVQEILPGDRHHYLAQNLRENVLYKFSVRARTIVGWGPYSSRNITIGPQPGSPDQPGLPVLTPSEMSVTLTWVNGDHGDSNITGYIIQAQEKSNSAWERKTNINSPEPRAIIPYDDLKPMTEYRFRVIAINSVGISHPSDPSEFLRSWEVEGESEPFHKKWWFLVIIALIGLIVIIIVVFLLCLLGRRKKPDKYKGQQTVRAPPFPLNGVVQPGRNYFPMLPAPSLPRTMVQLSEHGSSPEEDGGFSTFDDRRSIRQSARSERSVRSTRSMRSQRSQRGPVRHTLQRNGAIGGYAKSPPRPSPGSVNYSDEDYKTYGEDSSSTSEKPSEYSSSNNSQASDSDNDDKELPPPPFPAASEYSSNGDINHSYKGSGPQNSYSPYNTYTSYNPAYNSYPDSEQDSQTYAMSLNGGHVIMNNMARSRAPLPGFSSFV